MLGRVVRGDPHRAREPLADQLNRCRSGLHRSADRARKRPDARRVLAFTEDAFDHVADRTRIESVDTQTCIGHRNKVEPPRRRPRPRRLNVRRRFQVHTSDQRARNGDFNIHVRVNASLAPKFQANRDFLHVRKSRGSLRLSFQAFTQDHDFRGRPGRRSSGFGSSSKLLHGTS